MKRNSILKNPQFLMGLGMLVLNDYWLKWQFHNWFTGKLSDVVGLYFFPVFVCSFFPKYKKHIYWLVALLFVFWKSSLSGGFIAALHGLHLPFARVVDYSDFIALVALPVSYKYSNVQEAFNESGSWPVAFVALLVFCADSLPTRHLMEPSAQYEQIITIDTKLSEQGVFARMDSLGIKYYRDSTTYGHYYYDTSHPWGARSPVGQDRRNARHFWRIKNYAARADTIRNINFRVTGQDSAGRMISIIGFDINSVGWKEDKQKYRKQKRKYKHVLKREFARMMK